ncbi:MAG: hypothetical protein HZB47_07825 [Nitrosomonadales bacterium]|nr:hypothetical protein [Nitrosomonadales bacterium]
MPSQWTFKQLHYTLIFVLSGCAASLPPYLEPNPAQASTAKLRTVVVAGVNASVTLHQNNNSNNCLIENGAVAIPVHTNVSGFAGESKKKIGMPFADTYWGKIGSEVYIPVKDDLTLSVSFSGAGGTYGASCRIAFRFKPMPEKNYQLFVQAGQQKGGRGACIIEFQEIYEDDVSKQMIRRDVVRSPVIVKESPAWKSLCGGGQ